MCAKQNRLFGASKLQENIITGFINIESHENHNLHILLPPSYIVEKNLRRNREYATRPPQIIKLGKGCYSVSPSFPSEKPLGTKFGPWLFILKI